MAITIAIPGPLRPHARGRAAVVIEPPCASLGEALAALGARWPGVLDRVMTEQGTIRPHVNVFVGDENCRDVGGLATEIADGSTITILAAVSGG